MSLAYQYPSQAAVGQVLPKKKLYEQVRATPRIKGLFVEQVEKITWAYKLAPETINLAATPAVPEIQVFHITLKGRSLHHDVLACIDKVIPLPLVFELHHTERYQTVACHKRPSEADSNKTVCSDYFATEWQANDTPRQPLPVQLDLGALYLQLLQGVAPHPQRAAEAVDDWISRGEQIARLTRDITALDAKIRKEQQFNRRIALNGEKKTLSAKLASLST